MEPGDGHVVPFVVDARYTSADFFPMFGVPFAFGAGWTGADDDSRAQVVVISKELNDKLFGGGNSVGKTLRASDNVFRIVGVLAALYLTRPALNHERLTQALLALGSASFFVYAAHEPLLMVLRMLAYSNIPLDAPYTVLAIYLLLPALVIAFLVLCHGVLKRTCPRLLGLITGGR